MKTIILIGAALVASGLFLCCAPEQKQDQDQTLASIGSGAVVLYGDSRVSQDLVTSLCGAKVYNAGISGATAATVARSVNWADLRRYPPLAVVVSVGINDTYTGQTTPEHDLVNTLTDLATDLRGLGVWVIVTTIMLPEAKDRGLWVDMDYTRRVNQAVLDWSEAERGPVLDLEPLAFPDFTSDGIHYRQEFYTALHQRYEQAQCGTVQEP